jgi:hypothetical protein
MTSSTPNRSPSNCGEVADPTQKIVNSPLSDKISVGLYKQAEGTVPTNQVDAIGLHEMM